MTNFEKKCKKMLKKTEIDLVIEAVNLSSGYDFSNYAEATLRRRLLDFQKDNNLKYLSEIIPLILHNEAALRKTAFKKCLYL